MMNTGNLPNGSWEPTGSSQQHHQHQHQRQHPQQLSDHLNWRIPATCEASPSEHITHERETKRHRPNDNEIKAHSNKLHNFDYSPVKFDWRCVDFVFSNDKVTDEAGAGMKMENELDHNRWTEINKEMKEKQRYETLSGGIRNLEKEMKIMKKKLSLVWDNFSLLHSKSNDTNNDQSDNVMITNELFNLKNDIKQYIHHIIDSNNHDQNEHDQKHNQLLAILNDVINEVTSFKKQINTHMNKEKIRNTNANANNMNKLSKQIKDLFNDLQKLNSNTNNKDNSGYESLQNTMNNMSNELVVINKEMREIKTQTEMKGLTEMEDRQMNRNLLQQLIDNTLTHDDIIISIIKAFSRSNVIKAISKSIAHEHMQHITTTKQNQTFKLRIRDVLTTAPQQLDNNNGNRRENGSENANVDVNNSDHETNDENNDGAIDVDAHINDNILKSTIWDTLSDGSSVNNSSKANTSQDFGVYYKY